jgi:1-acyl-sn-glycerol-3-phosphate acyltransferase
MHKIIVEKPYHFVAPHPGRFWPRLIALLLPLYLRRWHGVVQVDFRGLEHLRASVSSGHGILLTPNHCRPCDPMVLGLLARAAGQPFFVMASRHLFEQHPLQTWLLRRAGAFSVYREGLDRDALRAAVDILRNASRPLVLFPEGVITRTNDRLNPLMDGMAFIAHSAAKQRADRGQVVIHPVAMRYLFEGNLEAALTPTVEELERRLSWRPKHQLTLHERLAKVGVALLGLKEVEYFGEVRPGPVAERIQRLIDRLLVPLEAQWVKGQGDGDVVARVKRLRTAMVPDLANGDLSEDERVRRWAQLEEVYLAQQLSFYPPDYIEGAPAHERLLETAERFEEDLTDHARVYSPIRAVVTVGPALPVSPARERGVADPLVEQVRASLDKLLSVPREALL